MAEYIDKGGLIKFLDNLQQPKIPITEGFKYITIDDAIKIVSERPAANVIPIPDGATNGDMIKAMFPTATFCDDMSCYGYVYSNVVRCVENYMMTYSKSWRNAPYKKEVKE